MSAIIEMLPFQTLPGVTVTQRHRRLPVAGQSAQPTELESRQLLQGRSEVWIRHGGELYRLRHTRNDKLILTK